MTDEKFSRPIPGWFEGWSVATWVAMIGTAVLVVVWLVALFLFPNFAWLFW